MQIFDIFEGTAPRIVVTYPGRFQPFHKGHRDVFLSLQKKFGSDNVYIVSSDKVDPPRSPFSFSDKVQFMRAAGIPAHSIIQASQVYDLPAQFQAEKSNIVFVTALGAPEAQRLGTGKQKKDGSPAYFQPMPGDARKLATADKHGYVVIEPEHSQTITVGGDTIDVSHGTQTRALWSKISGNPQLRKEFITQMYGKYHAELEPILDKIASVAESTDLSEGSAIERKISRTQALIQDYYNHARATKNDIKRDHYIDMARQLESDLEGMISDANQAEQDGHEIEQHDATPSATWNRGGLAEDAAAVGVVKNSKDPRYVMATMGDQNDVDASTLGKMMKGYDLVGKNPANTKQKSVTGAVGKGLKEGQEIDEVSTGDYYTKAHKSKISNIAKTMFADPAKPEVQAAARAIRNREAGMKRVGDRNRKAMAAQQDQARADSLKSDTVNIDQLKARLAQLRAEFDPDYEFSDNHSEWTHHRAIAQQINALQRRINDVSIGLDEDDEVYEHTPSGDPSPVESAICRRIMMQHRDALMKYGPDKIMTACHNKASEIGPVDEIGSSDVSAWTREVLHDLENEMFEGLYSYDKLDPYNSEFAPSAGMGRMTLRGWKQSLTKRVEQLARELEAAGKDVDRGALWDHVYKKLKSMNLDPIAQEIEQGQKELEQIRRKGGPRSRAFGAR